MGMMRPFQFPEDLHPSSDWGKKKRRKSQIKEIHATCWAGHKYQPTSINGQPMLRCLRVDCMIVREYYNKGEK